MDETNANAPTRRARWAALGSGRGRSFWERIRAEDSYGILLVFIVASLIVTAVVGGSRLGRGIVVMMQGGVLLFALWTSRVPRRLFRVALLIVPLFVVAASVASGGSSDAATGSVSTVSVVLTITAIWAIVRRLAAHPRVDGVTILGALSIYLLIGSAFAAAFALVGSLSNGSFFVAEAAPRWVDFLYFSFVTLTTTGYGDMVARTDLGRMLAVTEALLGQLYLVSVVALVIGNLGSERKLR
jgi:Ion channel